MQTLCLREFCQFVNSQNNFAVTQVTYICFLKKLRPFFLYFLEGNSIPNVYSRQVTSCCLEMNFDIFILHPLTFMILHKQPLILNVTAGNLPAVYCRYQNQNNYSTRHPILQARGLKRRDPKHKGTHKGHTSNKQTMTKKENYDTEDHNTIT